MQNDSNKQDTPQRNMTDEERKLGAMQGMVAGVGRCPSPEVLLTQLACSMRQEADALDYLANVLVGAQNMGAHTERLYRAITALRHRS